MQSILGAGGNIIISTKSFFPYAGRVLRPSGLSDEQVLDRARRNNKPTVSSKEGKCHPFWL